MALPDFSMRQLLEAGAHFGHQSHRWNPKMAPFIFGTRNNIHILDLAQTVPMLHRALQAISDTVAAGGRVLFVGTKRQAADAVADAAKRSAQYYVNARWLGGMLTNWKTISGSIQRLRKVDEILAGGAQGLTKKERTALLKSLRWTASYRKAAAAVGASSIRVNVAGLSWGMGIVCVDTTIGGRGCGRGRGLAPRPRERPRTQGARRAAGGHGAGLLSCACSICRAPRRMPLASKHQHVQRHAAG